MHERFFRFIALFWLALTLPLLFFGYGSDLDAWRVARSAEEIWRSGCYVSSRSTGFPLHELFMAPLVHFGGWFLSNLFSLLSGLGLLWLLWRYAHEAPLRHPRMYLIAFAFLPVLMKNATSTMDYIPALALMMAAFLVLRRGRQLSAAILLGLACGFRPASLLFLLPLSWYHWRQRRNALSVLQMALVTAGTALVCFIPFLQSYGRLFVPRSFIHHDWLTRAGSFILHSFSLLGFVPTIALLIFFALHTPARFRIRSSAGMESRFHLINILLWIALFVVLPEEPEYLLPLLPSLWFFVDRVASRGEFLLLTAVMLSYHVIQLDLRGGEPVRRELHPALKFGMTIRDLQDRRFKLATRSAASECRPQKPTVLMLGAEWIPVANPDWHFDDQWQMYRQNKADLWVSPRLIDESRLRTLKSAGMALMVWRGQMREYRRPGTAYVFDYVKVIDNLDDFFGRSLPGAPLPHR